MFKDFIKQQTGIEIFPLISLSLFVLFFLVLFIVVMSYRKSFIKEISHLPLEEAINKNNFQDSKMNKK